MTSINAMPQQRFIDVYRISYDASRRALLNTLNAELQNDMQLNPMTEALLRHPRQEELGVLPEMMCHVWGITIALHRCIWQQPLANARNRWAQSQTVEAMWVSALLEQLNNLSYLMFEACKVAIIVLFVLVMIPVGLMWTMVNRLCSV